MPLGVALLPRPVYLLLFAKTPNEVNITILGMLVQILMLITCMHWSMAVGFIVLGIIADVITAGGKYKSFKLTIIGYELFILANATWYAMFFRSTELFDLYEKKNSLVNPTYVDTMVSTGQSWMLLAIIIGTIICAIISGLIGKRLLKNKGLYW